jgi:hypothetical protein
VKAEGKCEDADRRLVAARVSSVSSRVESFQVGEFEYVMAGEERAVLFAKDVCWEEEAWSVWIWRMSMMGFLTHGNAEKADPNLYA